MAYTTVPVCERLVCNSLRCDKCGVMKFRWHGTVKMSGVRVTVFIYPPSPLTLTQNNGQALYSEWILHFRCHAHGFSIMRKFIIWLFVTRMYVICCVVNIRMGYNTTERIHSRHEKPDNEFTHHWKAMSVVATKVQYSPRIESLSNVLPHGWKQQHFVCVLYLS